MEVTFKSKTRKNVEHCFSDQTPYPNLIEKSPHLADNFSYDPTSHIVNLDRFRSVLSDCASPELLAVAEDGIDSTIRYIKAFGLRAQPLHVYTIDREFYKK